MAHRFLFLLLMFGSLTQAGAQYFNTEKLDSLVAAVDQHNKLMGSLTISKKGKILYNKAWGYRTITEKEQLKTNSETKFRIGSISKMFTSVMILQLVEEGKLKLSTPLSDFFPNMPNAKDISIEQLLNHHSGLYNFTDSNYLSFHTQPKTHEEMLAMFEKQTPAFAPGTNAEYSNTNYVLLGYIIENITGETYAANLKKRITGKIGLKNTYYGSKPEAEKNEASSFSYNGKVWEEEAETHMSITGGAGSLVSTTSDLVKFAEALFSNKLIKRSSLDKMIDLKDRYGLGIFQFPFDEKYCYGHTGGIDEFHSMLGYFPEDNMTFAFTGNGQAIEMNDFAIGVLSIYFNRTYKIPDFNVAEYKLAAEKLAKYEGTYASSQMPMKITIKKNGDRLTAQATGQGAFYLTTISETEFKFDPAKLSMSFNLENDGAIKKFILKQGGGNYTFVKEEN